MAINIVVPELGESVIEATVLRWLKQQGESVSPGETVVELETDKVNLDVSAPAAGVLARVTHGQGEDVKIGDVLGVIEPVAQVAATEPNGSTQPAAPAPTPVAVAPTPAAPVLPAMSTTVAPAASIVFSGVPDGAPHEAEHEDLRATPVAERMATEYGIDLHDVMTNPPDGRITRQDIESYLEKVKPAPPTLPTPAPPTAPVAPVTTSTPPTVAMTPALQAGSAAERAGREERKKMSRRRQTIARRLVEAQQTAAMLTTFNEADMSAVMNIRKQHKEAFAQRYEVGLGITSFFAKAAIRALQDFPIVNAEIQGDEIVYKHYYDIGVAVGAAEGLVVPVLRDAEMLSFATIEKKIKEFSKKAEDGTLTLEDLRGGTFTITNGGVFGSLMSTPILNPPQPAILGLHKIQERPIAVQGQVVVRPMMYLALSYDHRLIDGREAVQFLVRIKEMIEDPTALLLDS